MNSRRAPDELLTRLGKNERTLVDACDVLAAALQAKRRIAPAGEWLLDNFHLIEEQIRTARRHLPRGYSEQLPRAGEGSSSGLPRVYGLASQAIAHGDGRVDPESLAHSVDAFQAGTILKLGELWAVPIMLRLALIENLRRVAADVVAATEHRASADYWAEQMLEVTARDPKSLILVIADMARSNPPMVSSFVAVLARRLQGRGPALALGLTWIEQQLTESGSTIEQLVQLENQQQAANQVSVSNSIGSLRLLGAIDWRAFVETMSGVERKLREDPTGVYGRMDFATRDRYRHVVERIARESGLAEEAIAGKAIELAGEALTREGAGARSAHVGCYLIAEGLPALVRAAKPATSAFERLRERLERRASLLYRDAILLLVLAFTGALLEIARAAGAQGWMLALIGVLGVAGASQLAIALANRLAGLLVMPRLLPRMDLSSGIPPGSRTLVIVPAMLGSAAGVESLLERLEVRFLANRDRCLHFGLLTDFPDAPSEKLPGDEPLLELARSGVEALNERYRSPGDGMPGESFFLFHRPRRWNEQEALWMGYERKRGKLAELNALLRGGSSERFALIVGEAAVLAGVKYVITLDTDTELPRNAARELVATMAHPLNQALYDAEKGRIVAGYGILQPRVAASLAGTHRSRYARLNSSEPGIDPYSRAVSDVYQDLFGEGSYIGKGIYDVDAFERALEGRFPENRVLSHDLLEGCYARSGLLSDVQLYEEYPSRYAEDVSRRYRWIRGDWQIAQWLLPRVPGIDGRKRSNELSALSRWKIFDNLRRSVVPAALVLLLLTGWTAVPPAWFWTLAVAGVFLVVPLLSLALELIHPPVDARMGRALIRHISSAARSAGRNFIQAAFTLACLPHEAWYSLGAILRTAGRMLFTRKLLLEWRPSGEERRGLARWALLASWRSMWIAPATAAAAAALLATWRPESLVAASPVLALWVAAPVLAWWISRPLPRRAARLSAAQSAFLRTVSRRTWAFFETFTGAEDHWLPPDNFQEHPGAMIAHRTSPTNMGLALLANLSAYDFGYASVATLLDRTGRSLQSMQDLERYQGHFYNWYDTQSLKPLQPLYVSSVDSGNLAGHLLTLRAGLLELADQRVIPTQALDGLGDTLRILLQAGGESAAPFTRTLLRLAGQQPDASAAASVARRWIEALARCAQEYATALAGTAAAPSQPAPDAEAAFWASTLARQCRDFLDELALFAPWTAMSAPEGAADRVERLFNPTLRDLAQRPAQTLRQAGYGVEGAASPEEQAWREKLHGLVAQATEHARQRIAAIERLAQQAGDLARMDYEFLYDKVRHLLAIGYNVSERRRDASYYDLLASEARLACFVGIAQGQLPQESWFALGRRLTVAGGEPVLLSWSGSLFEYLMPLLVMPDYGNTLLDDTCRAAVARQIQYGRERGVPWGISESCYNALDASLSYQYRAFGVPGLGIKRGLEEDLVVAPYASALALMVAPEAACANLERLDALGLQGRYGFYEALDYTAARLPRGRTSEVIRAFMAHHQGMALLSLECLLLGGPMQRRFEADRQFQATLLLLQERVPKTPGALAQNAARPALRTATVGPEMPVRVLRTPDTPLPEVQLLSNGRYHVMVTNAGGGYSRWKDLAVTRWREDATCDNWGSFCYIRDVASGAFWSAAHQPTLEHAQSYEAIFSEARAEFRRRDHDYETHAEIVVSPEDDMELRRLTITNRSRARRSLDLTSYAEVVLAPAAADDMHPAFSNLFVQTEIVAAQQAILCTRRPRSAGERVPWLFHAMAVHGAQVEQSSYETDRMRFIGRGRSVQAPQAMNEAELSGAAGSVLDPIVAIRRRISLDPEQSVTIDIFTGVGETRAACLALAAKCPDRHHADRVFDLAWTHSWVTLRQINATESDAQLYGRLASAVLYANSPLRAAAAILLQNRRGQSGLWGYAISGDLPIVLVQIADPANIPLVRRMVQAHAYWQLKGLSVDLVIWNEDHSSYRQVLHDQIMSLIATSVEAHLLDRPGGIFVRRAEQIANEDRVLLQSVARAIISDSRGMLAEQMEAGALARVRPAPPNLPGSAETRPRAELASPGCAAKPPGGLAFFNGLGGFSADGREYVITTTRGQTTPAPWVNVLANPSFGTTVSESGLAGTWSENAHEFRLTPWCNDPVSDSGEAFYVRDEDNGQFWSPSPLPSPGAGPYVTRHGFGYSVFEHDEGGIGSELCLYVALDAPIKFAVLKLRNSSGRARRLSVTGYAEWVLADLRPKSMMHVITEIDAESGAMFARNPYNAVFGQRVALFAVDDKTRLCSGDRAEFLGRNGSLSNPAAMMRSRLSGRTGAALDPCAALQVSCELAKGEEREVVFMLGAARSAADARLLVQRFRAPGAARAALEQVRHYWRRTLGAVQIRTPDPSLDMLANGWLLYQTLACRLWARSAHYQPGGAFGFRDQLQDAMALVHCEPGLLREQLLLCASRQFREGDVQHWWHPPSGRGVRTHCSDDFLWLPLAACRYVAITGDTAVLDESSPYLAGRAVADSEDSYYDLPERSEKTGTLYEHCVQAILRGLRFGEHGLPLIGSGDWNDGMNLVGEHGKGESVWLGFFLYEVLTRFGELARQRGEVVFAERCAVEAARLRSDLEQHGWDGAWYRRAYFDDGSPLGSATNEECRIDSIAQSWSVLSGAADPARSRQAMEALDQQLVRRDDALVRLLDPPFDKSALEPGYIKGYVPGVRENGGQYTHAAIWAAMAFARSGDHRRAWEIMDLINPLHHGGTPQAIARYKVEPYVMAADVYAVPPHVGRGGWTWYTGAAGWTYRLILESLLGLRRQGDTLRFAPCLPAEWNSYEVDYRHGETLYRVTVVQSRAEEAGATLDGVEQPGGRIPLVDDHQEHAVEVRCKARAP